MIATMEILDATGHLTLSWDPEVPEQVDTARAEFDRLKEKGYIFFATEPEEVAAFEAERGELVAREAPVLPVRRKRGEPKAKPGEPKPTMTRKFEPRAKRTVAVPRMRGG